MDGVLYSQYVSCFLFCCFDSPFFRACGEVKGDTDTGHFQGSEYSGCQVGEKQQPTCPFKTS